MNTNADENTIKIQDWAQSPVLQFMFRADCDLDVPHVQLNTTQDGLLSEESSSISVISKRPHILGQVPRPALLSSQSGNLTSTYSTYVRSPWISL